MPRLAHPRKGAPSPQGSTSPADVQAAPVIAGKRAQPFASAKPAKATPLAQPLVPAPPRRASSKASSPLAPPPSSSAAQNHPGTSQAVANAPLRRPRADAQRNRERILEIARDAFTLRGAEASLDDIARRANVGPGTLYRHFPTREDLIAAVYHREVHKLVESSQRFAETLPPLEALRSWMLLFIDYVAQKLLILPALDTLPGGSEGLILGSSSVVRAAFHSLIEHAIRSGDLRPSLQPDDLSRALIGVFHTTAFPGWEASARRIVDILLAGSRPT